MAKELNLNINPLVVLLAGLFECGKNSVYKTKDIAYRIVQSAVHNQSLEAMFKLTNYLSADRMLSKLHSLSIEETREMLRRFNRKIKLPGQITLAIDFTDKLYYGDKNHPDVMGSKGGDYVRKYIEISTVELPLCIDILPVNQLTNEKVLLLTDLLKSFYGLYSKTKIKILLLDRGFYTIEVVKFLVEHKIKFIMPAIKNKSIDKQIALYRTKRIYNKVRYTFGSTTVNLLFIDVEDDTLVYITNTNKTPLEAHLIYDKRWQIETNFREQNKFTFKTNTLDFTIRYLALVVGGILFNAWQLTRRLLPYILESYLFKQYLIDEILGLWQSISKRSVVKKIDYLLVA